MIEASVKIIPTRMWQRGPLRQMAASKVTSTFIPYTRTINDLTFAGRYICDRCTEPSQGVYRQNVGEMSGNGHSSEGIDWLCDSCVKGRIRVPLTSEQRQTASMRLAGLRAKRAALSLTLMSAGS